MSDTLTIATFNANSIRTRLDQIIAWMAQGHADVLCIQETKVQDTDFPAEPIRNAGYQVAYRGQKAYAGVAIISREELSDVAYGLDDDGEPDEARLIRAVVRGIPLVNTYVPQGREADHPQFQYKLAWLARVRAFFERHYAPDKPLVWVGDLNVAPEPMDLHDPKANKEHVDFHPLAREALARVREWGLVDVFRRHHPDEPGQYTYFDYRVRNAVERQVGWRVDHIYATASLAERSLGAWIDVQARQVGRPSDHTFLVAEFAL